MKPITLALHLLLSRRLTTAVVILLGIIGFTLAPTIAVDEQPTLQFSTYLGGNSGEYGSDIAVDRAGNIYVTGETGSANFPAATPHGVGPGGIYVAKFDPSGTTQLYSIFLGSGRAYGIAVDADGYAYVVGGGSGIPMVNAIQPTPSVGGDTAFIARINPSGTALVYSTYLPGYIAFGVALDSNKNAYIVGTTGTDAFVVRMNAAGSAFNYTVSLGGSDWDDGFDIAVDNDGNAYITGRTASTNFPTLNAYQTQHDPGCFPPSVNRCMDAFVAKLSPSGVIIYSTYLGGDGRYDHGYGIAVDSTGSAYVAGYTDSTNFPVTVNAYQTTAPSATSAFVTKFSPDGSALEYSTYLNGVTDVSGITERLLGIGIDVNSEGQAYVVGVTAATDFPTVNPIQATKAGAAGKYDTFITQFSADGSTLLFSTYFGGSKDEYIEFSPRMALDYAGSVYLTGSTYSDDFPILHAFQADPGGTNFPTEEIPNMDAFVAKIGYRFVPYAEPGQAAERNYFTTHTPKLTWKPVTWALNYRIEVDRTLSFSAPLDFDASGSADSVVINLPTNGFYYWRIQTQKPDGSWTPWNVMDSFTVFVDD